MFEVGDRVMCIVDYPDNNEDIVYGSMGTVCEEPDSDDYIGVCWDDDVDGHDCSGNCEHGHGWRVQPGQIELVVEDDGDDTAFPFDEQEFKALIGMTP